MWRQSLFRWLSAVLAMVVFSVECSMYIDLDLTLCGGNKGDLGFEIFNCSKL